MIEIHFGVSDLYEDVYKVIGIPIVFDYHHRKFCDGGLTEEEALNLVQNMGYCKACGTLF